MRVDAVTSAGGGVPRIQRAAAEEADKTNHQATPSPRGKAHGVVRKLGTGHYNATAEARLTSHFGHLVQTEPPEADADVDVDPDVQIDVDGDALIIGRSLDLWA